MSEQKIILGRALIDGYGGLNQAWRAPHVDPGNYADMNATFATRRQQSGARSRSCSLPIFRRCAGTSSA